MIKYLLMNERSPEKRLSEPQLRELAFKNDPGSNRRRKAALGTAAASSYLTHGDPANALRLIEESREFIDKNTAGYYDYIAWTIAKRANDALAFQPSSGFWSREH